MRRHSLLTPWLCLTALALIAAEAGAEAWTYDFPGGQRFSSHDYEVSVESGGKRQRSYVYHSFGLDRYERWDLQGRRPQPRDYPKRDVTAHSYMIFSFSGAVTVRVTVKEGAKHITLPLKSAKVLPSSYGIPCTIENGNTIVFTLDRPEKVAVVPNYEQAWGKFEDLAEGHLAAQSWKETYQELAKRPSWHGRHLLGTLSEGYRNPLIILAHPPEADRPDRSAASTLVVRPGDPVTQPELDRYETVWFAPGVHDLSRMGEEPWNLTLVRKGQTVYLEGGAYVMARFKRNDDLGEGPTVIKGRGVISGIGHTWVCSFERASQIISIDSLSGVTITDRACFGIYGGRDIRDIAMLGAWHGNTDGPDYLDNCTIQDCFLMAHDDNLKLNDNTRARHLVIWQLANAHAIMVKEMRDHVTFAGSVVEDVDILAYNKCPADQKHPWGRLGPGALSIVTGTDLKINAFTYRNIRIEAPYLYRVFSLYNLDTTQNYTPEWFGVFPPTSPSRHTRIDGLTFENITVNSPLIAYRSLLGSAYTNAIRNVRFINLKINGTTVTDSNKEAYFEIEPGKVEGLSFTAQRSP